VEISTETVASLQLWTQTDYVPGGSWIQAWQLEEGSTKGQSGDLACVRCAEAAQSAKGSLVLSLP